jgi:hypothetical protein
MAGVMMRRMSSLVPCVALLVACGRETPVNDLPEGTTFPHVVTGALEISVEEGPVGEDDISEINFGELTVEGTTLLVSVSGDVVREGGRQRSDLFSESNYRVTLAGIDPLSAKYGATTYQISKIQSTQ